MPKTVRCPKSPDREFHVSRAKRDEYAFDDVLFSLTGNVVFADFHAARLFAQKINAKRDLIRHPEQAVRAGEINAMGLIDEILHFVVQRYREERNPTVMKAACTYLEETLGAEALDVALRKFVDQFPPIAVYRGEITPAAYLKGETQGTPNRQVALEELLLLYLANANPAFEPYLELFDDADLELQTAYPQLIDGLESFFETQPGFGPENKSLFKLLREPAERARTLNEQLAYIREHWSSFLGAYLQRLLKSLDFLAEEQKMFFGLGPGPAEVPEFDVFAEAPERFSPDSDWMPNLVLIAKNVYVWLDQLSKQYRRDIHRLDQVPDEELEKLRRWGITGLWLIGLWERSEASKRIKQMMGNPEAVASAYSLYDYAIAGDLGGEAAFNELKARAWRYGIRMASDMVPNHMGIDSKWVIEHPDWFISLDYSPFPTYTFNGPDLCDDDRVGIYIEDHYYNRSDAAVVFKRRDHWTGDEKYIYHGNDGTSMPWNDTAQLNFLKKEVREAVIQTILHVARHTPIIRFDAAMTLTKKHYQRLWFPEPGSGGDIPSRAEFGMTKEAFDKAMPEEFWREVVDRVHEEVPDTLLLAEAFWLMEGYFVRTLGMHRVYNSAFMNMLRDEKNDEYRQLIKNTLEFDPEILKRYVNFMNNPDERTAVDQFGKGDKYFGICTMMGTLPGLPMFGHGQIEGYAEKYGMEFRRAYWDESPDPYLVERHEREIFPLLHKRYLFAEARHFRLYDFYTAGGTVDENVFVYSNRAGGERSLVLYHNRYATTAGWVRTSTAYARKEENGEKHLEQTTLAEALDLSGDPNRYLIFRDAIGGLEYIRNCRELTEQGLYAKLRAYQAHVFLDFREVQENAYGHYGQLHARLAGRGVPDIEEALKEQLLEPVHVPLRMLISAPAFEWLMKARHTETRRDDERVAEQVEQKMMDLLRAVRTAADSDASEERLRQIAEEVSTALEVLLDLPTALKPMEEKIRHYVLEMLEEDDPARWGTLFGWLFTHRLGAITDKDTWATTSYTWLEDWLLGKVIAEALRDMELPDSTIQRAVATIKLLIRHHSLLIPKRDAEAYDVLYELLSDQATQAYLGVNRYEGVLWFNKEAFDSLLWWLLVATIVTTAFEEEVEAQEAIAAQYALITALQEAEAASEYQVEKLLEAAGGQDEVTPQSGEASVEARS
ncbi:MAG: alpha-amylase family glycosyl hydrolase [Anaerolineae bacterium]